MLNILNNVIPCPANAKVPADLATDLPFLSSTVLGVALKQESISNTDLLTKYTGKSTYEHIHLRLIDKAQQLLWSTDAPISAIAYDLGFEHPFHFTKLFKNKTGYLPKMFRNLN